MKEVLGLVAGFLLVGLLWTREGGRSAPATPPHRRHVVEIRGFEYVPRALEAARGDTVVWVNRDAVPHTATSADGGFDSGSIVAGARWSQVLDESDSTAYLCTFHPGMTAIVVAR